MARTAPPAIDRVILKTRKADGGCLLWTGAKNNSGYGAVSSGGKPRGVHRVVYEHCVGPITAGLQIDHLCRNRACVNPLHLEPVTSRQNVLRGVAPNALIHTTGVCRHGHVLTTDNKYLRRNGTVTCHTCLYARNRKWNAKQKEKRLAGRLRNA